MAIRVKNIQKRKADPKRVKALLDLEESADNYNTVRTQIKKLEKEKAEARDALKSQVKLIGNTDEDGHVTAVSSGYVVTVQKRVPREFDEDMARKILAKKGLLRKVERTETYLDRDMIADLHEEGKISKREIEAMMPEGQTTEALTIKELPRED